MISVKKLKTLPPSTRVRKYLRLLREFEETLKGPLPPRSDFDQLQEYLAFMAQDPACPQEFREAIISLTSRSTSCPVEEPESFIRNCNHLRHLLLRYSGKTAADWDLLPPGGYASPSAEGRRLVFPLDLYLEDIRSPFNTGSLFRTAESFGVRSLLLSPHSADPDHPRCRRSAMGTVDILPWRRCPKEKLLEEVRSEADYTLVVLETQGTPLETFSFPEKGVLVVGSEELGVGPEILTFAARQNRVVSISTGGIKGSLNVSVAAGIVLQRWFSAHFNKNLADNTSARP